MMISCATGKLGGAYLCLFNSIAVIFKVYDSDHNGKVSFKDILEVLKDLSGSFMSDEQREVSPNKYMQKPVFSKMCHCYLTALKSEFNVILLPICRRF